MSAGGTAGGEEPPLIEFVAVMRRLRELCPWKAEQTHRSLARYLIEETHETLEAIDEGEETGDWAHLREELGDLLLQVYFHAVIAEQAGEFTIDGVAGGIIAKMRRRNPHVFEPGAAREMSAHEVNEAWQAAKATEKQRSSVAEGIPPTLPALLHADKVLDRLERAGARTPSLDAEADLGDRLLGLVAESREAGVDPEQALRDAVRRLVARHET